MIVVDDDDVDQAHDGESDSSDGGVGDVDEDIEDDYSATSDCTQGSLSSFHFQADTDMDGFKAAFKGFKAVKCETTRSLPWNPCALHCARGAKAHFHLQ